MQFGRQQQMKDQQMKMEQERLAIERENAMSTRAYQKGMTDAIARKEAEAKRQAEALAKVFGSTVEEPMSPDTEGYIEGVMGPQAPTMQKRGLTAAEALREYGRMGAPVTDETVRLFGALGGEEANRAKERQRQLELEGKLGDTERKLQMRELEMELANRDPVISLLLRQRKMGEITEDEYRAAIKKQIEFLQTKDPSMFDRMMELSALSGGGGGGGAGGKPSTTRPGGTTGSSAVNRFR
jgi:hypothetical protein